MTRGPHERAMPTSCPARPFVRATSRRRSPRARSRADRGTTAWPRGSCWLRRAGASTPGRSRNFLGTERLGELSHPEIYKIEIGGDAGLASGVGRHDNCLRVGALRDVHDLAAIVVVGREQHLNVLIAHCRDDFLNMARRGGNTRFRLDVIEARHLEFARKIVPLFVIAGHEL